MVYCKEFEERGAPTHCTSYYSWHSSATHPDGYDVCSYSRISPELSEGFTFFFLLLAEGVPRFQWAWTKYPLTLSKVDETRQDGKP